MKWSARHTPNLSQCQCDIKNVCCVTRENVKVCCSHSPSVAADCYQLYTIRLQQVKKTACQSVTLSSLVRKRLQQVTLFCDAAHFTSSEGIDFDEFTSSTSDHSTMMYWMKKTTNAISDTGRKESVQIALLQIHGEDSAYLLVLLGSLIGVSSVHFCQMCSER